MSKDKNRAPENKSDELLSTDTPALPRPSYVGRLFAIVLLIAAAPVLLFSGYCGLMTMASPLGLIGLGIFGAVAFVTYKGVGTLWRLHESPDGTGWIIVLVLLLLFMGALALWASQLRF